MKQLGIIALMMGASVVVAVLCSAGNVENAVYTVEDGVYYHVKGDCACQERSHDHSHDHSRKIRLQSKETAEAGLFLPCRKCAK